MRSTAKSVSFKLTKHSKKKIMSILRIFLSSKDKKTRNTFQSVIGGLNNWDLIREDSIRNLYKERLEQNT